MGAAKKNTGWTHTTGPWIVGNLSGEVLRKADGHAVASPPEDVDPDSRRWRTDARLIAAAPELLEALDALAAFVEDDTCRHDHEKAGPLSQARTAISGARGEG